MTGDIGQNLKEYVEGRFVVGPIAEKAFNENEPQSDVANRGPCMFYNYSSLPFQNVVANRSFLGCAGHDAKDYLVAIAQWERSKLTPREHTPDAETRDLQNEKLSTLDKFEAICSHLTPRAPQLSRPTIWHWDIRPDNLFVDNGHITDMIDWQDAWIGPFFLNARRPRLVDHQGEIALTLLDHYETIEDPDEKARVADHVEKSILLWCYEWKTKVRHAELHALFNLPQAQKRKDTVAFASELSDGEVTPLRGCLVELKRYVLTFSLSSPLDDSSADLA